MDRRKIKVSKKDIELLANEYVKKGKPQKQALTQAMFETKINNIIKDLENNILPDFINEENKWDSLSVKLIKDVNNINIDYGYERKVSVKDKAQLEFLDDSGQVNLDFGEEKKIKPKMIDNSEIEATEVEIE